MYTFKIKSATRNQPMSQIEIELGIYLGKEEVDTKKFGYADTMTEDEIKADLEKYKKNYIEEIRLAKVNKENEAKEKKVTQLLDSVKNIKI